MKNFYAIGAGIAIPLSTIAAFDSKPYHSYDEIQNLSPIKKGVSFIGYLTIGIFLGAIYPISFPLAAILTVMDDDNKNNNSKIQRKA
jgi:hypothetical protein